MLSKEETQMASSDEKMVNITNHLVNVNQSILRYHLTPARMAITKETTVNKAGEDVEGRGPKYTVGGM